MTPIRPHHVSLQIGACVAEFWIEGIGDNYGVDTNDSGTYLRASASDQVRFYRIDAATNVHRKSEHMAVEVAADIYPMQPDPVPITSTIRIPAFDQIPPLVFSEILRDVDLFVGVASVGNDPTWQDEDGPEGRYRAYWHNYSFGDLSETAPNSPLRARTGTPASPPLQRFCDRCSLSDRFLVVRGELRLQDSPGVSGNNLDGTPTTSISASSPPARRRMDRRMYSFPLKAMPRSRSF